MKRNILFNQFIKTFLVVLVFISCQRDDIGNTITGTWTGSGQMQNTNCIEEAFNETFDADFVMVLEESENGNNTFTGTLTAIIIYEGNTFSGTDYITGRFDSSNGTFQGDFIGSFGSTTSEGTINGTISGKKLIFSYSGVDTSGDTCKTNGDNITLIKD